MLGNLHLPPHPTPSIDTTTLPTEARLRQKQRLKQDKEAGIKPTKRKHVVEPGTDDCGDDLTGLGPDIALLSFDVAPEHLEDDDTDDDDYDCFFSIPTTITDNHTSIESAISYLCYGKYNRVDLIELCGGQGRISTVAFRRGLESGENLDLVTGCDLGEPATQRAINHYLDTCDVLVEVLQPNCRTTGRNSYYNSIMHYDTWQRHHLQDLPHIQCCGAVALKQIQLGRDFLRAQPSGTWIDHIEPWPQVVSHDDVVIQGMDQCMAGCKTTDGTPVKKPTEWTANSEILLKPFRKFMCDYSHRHAHPTGAELEKLKLYPWKLVGAAVQGIQDLKKYLTHTHIQIHIHRRIDTHTCVPSSIHHHRRDRHHTATTERWIGLSSMPCQPLEVQPPPYKTQRSLQMV